MNLLNKLAETTTLWITFVCTILLTISFQLASSHWGISFIDAISDPEAVRQAIASLTADQRIVHVWITATLDVAYPLAYGAFFVGSALAFYDRVGWYIAMAVLVVIPTDLIEGVVQVLALLDIADLVDAKAVLTPLKTVLFLFGLAATVVGWILWLIKRVRG